MTLPEHDRTDIQAVKREVIKLGRDRGYLDEEEIMTALPVEHMMADEIETFLFTLEMMEIDVRLKDGGKYKNAGKLALVGRSPES